MFSRTSTTNSKPLLLALLSVLLWSTSSVVAKLAESSVGYIGLTISMFSIGFIVFFGVAQNRMPIKQKLTELRSNNVLKTYLFYTSATGIFMGIYYYTFYFSIQSPYSVQANLINYLWPTITPVLAATVFKSSKSLGYKSIIALLLSFIGCTIVITGFDLQSISLTKYHLSAFIAALSAGLYMNFAMMAEDILDELPLIYMLGLGFALPFVILPAFIQPVTLQVTFETGAYILYVSVFTFVIANLAWTRSLIGGNTSQISALAYFIPVFSTILLTLISTPEQPLSIVLLGGGLIIAGQVLSKD